MNANTSTLHAPERGTVCLYSPAADGGMAQYTRELINALVDEPRGYGFELVSSEDLDPQFASDDYPVQRILPALRHRDQFQTRLSWAASRLTHYPRRERRFLKWLRTRPDVVGVHFQEWTPWLGGHVLPRIKAMGKSVFYTVHNVLPHRYPKWVPKALMNRWIRRSCLLCDGLFVLTERLASELSMFLGESHPPIHVAPHGVWTVPHSAGRPEPAQRLASKRLLFFGSIRRNKGLDLLLRAMPELPDYHLTIAGEPHEPEYYRSEVLPLLAQVRASGAAIELRDRFIPDSEVADLFATHSAIVMPYTSGFVAQSGVVFMALSHELPVVASEAGGLREVFEQFPIGRTFREFEPGGLARAIRDLHDTPESGVIEALRAAKRRFSWREAALATVTGYTAAIEKRSDRDRSPSEVAHAL